MERYLNSLENVEGILGENKKNILMINSVGRGKSFCLPAMLSKDLKILDNFSNRNRTTKTKIELVLTNDKAYIDKIRIVFRKNYNTYVDEKIYEKVIDTIVYMIQNYRRLKFKSNNDSFNFMRYEFDKQLKRDSYFKYVQSEILDREISNISEALREVSTLDYLSLRLGSLDNKMNRNEFTLRESRKESIIDIIVQNDLDSLRYDNKQIIKTAIKSFNSSIDIKFNEFFGNALKSKDKFSYIDIKKKTGEFIECDKKLLNSLFISNTSEDDSLFSLLSDVTIYASANENFLKRLHKNNLLNYFQDKNGTFKISILNAFNLYDENKSIRGIKDDIERLIYNNEYDSIIYTKSIENNSRIVEDVVAGLKRDIPVFILNDDIDLFISNKLKDDSVCEIDEFSNEENDVKFNINKCIADINFLIEKQNKKVLEVQSNKRGLCDIKSIPYILKCSMIDSKIKEEFSFAKAMDKVFQGLRDRYKEEKYVEFKLAEDLKERGLELYINDINFDSIISKYFIAHKLSGKKNSMKENISSNYGIRISKESYEGLYRHLCDGDGFESYISGLDQDYKNFKLNFQSTFKELISKELIDKLIKNACKFNGGKFVADDYNHFIKKLNEQRFYIAQSVVKNIFYVDILQQIEKENNFVSCSVKYNEFLSKAYSFIGSSDFEKRVKEEIKLALEYSFKIVVRDYVKYI